MAPPPRAKPGARSDPSPRGDVLPAFPSYSGAPGKLPLHPRASGAAVFPAAVANCLVQLGERVVPPAGCCR